MYSNPRLVAHGLLNMSSFIDEGRNPDEFTKHLLNGCVQQNQASKGKVDSFKVF